MEFSRQECEKFIKKRYPSLRFRPQFEMALECFFDHHINSGVIYKSIEDAWELFTYDFNLPEYEDNLDNIIRIIDSSIAA